MVGGASGTLVGIHASHHRSFQMFGQLLGDMDRKVVLLFCINNFNRFKFVHQHAGIAYLTAAFGIERSLVQYNLVQCLVFLLNLPVTQDGCFVFRIVIAYEFGCAFLQRNPVAGFNSGGVACALFLLLHFCVKLFDVGRHVVFAENQFRKVEWKAKSIIKRKGVLAADFGLSGCFGICHGLIQQTNTGLQSAEEGIFFFLDDFGYQLFLYIQFGIRTAHILNQYR